MSTTDNKTDKAFLGFAGYDRPNTETQALSVDYQSSNKDYVSYGADNQLPNTLWNSYIHCSILGGIINGTVDRILNKIDVLPSTHPDTMSKKLLESLLYDYLIFGGFSMESIKSTSGSITYNQYIPYERIRVDADKSTGFYSKKWSKYTNKYVKLPLNDNTAQHSFKWFGGRLYRSIYPIPMWFSALKSVEIQNMIKEFHLSTIQNNFNSSLIINMNNGVPTQELREEIEKKLNEKFSGPSNAGKLCLLFNDNKDSAATIERLESDKFDEKFQALDKSTKEDIFCSFRAQPILFGMQCQATFAKSEYLEADEIYNLNVVEPLTHAFVDALNDLVGNHVTLKE